MNDELMKTFIQKHKVIESHDKFYSINVIFNYLNKKYSKDDIEKVYNEWRVNYLKN